MASKHEHGLSLGQPMLTANTLAIRFQSILSNTSSHTNSASAGIKHTLALGLL